MMHLRKVVGVTRGLVGVTMLAIACGASGPPASPNVIVLLADDLGWADVGFHGSPIRTPSIDRLAREGVRIDRMYTAPICSPTRDMIMTGRDPMLHGIVYDQINPWDVAAPPPEETFLPQIFRDAGYRTAMIGKWHLGHAIEQQLPNARGFDHFYGHVNTAVDYYEHTRRGGHDWQRNGTSVHEQGSYMTDLEAREAVRYLRERDPDRPFLLYIAFNAPHSPMQAPEELIDSYASLGHENFRDVYAGMVTSMDSAIGEILDALDAEGIAENTLVLFLSDNGGFHGFGGANTPLRGQKGQAFEGGIRVPAVVRWPGTLPEGITSQQVVSAMDLMPTLAGAAGIELETRRPLDGRNVWPQLVEGRAEPRREDLFFASEIPVPGRIHVAVLRDEWKLVQIVQEHQTSMTVDTHLFRIYEDPYETTDLAEKHPEIVADLAERIRAWRSQHPLGGLRSSLVPHPGWLPPKDFTEVVHKASEVQPSTSPEFELRPEHIRAIGDRGVLDR